LGSRFLNFLIVSVKTYQSWELPSQPIQPLQDNSNHGPLSQPQPESLGYILFSWMEKEMAFFMYQPVTEAIALLLWC
jgi:hypothetical protein